MDENPMDDFAPTFIIGQHETKRAFPITSAVLRQARDYGYDILTTSITNDHFHTRVLTQLSNHLAHIPPLSYAQDGTLATSENSAPLIIPGLSPLDTPLTPNECVGQLIGVTSAWIDLCSPDPFIADVSRQVLMLETAYAAFCGITYLLIPGPKLHHGSLHGEGVLQYARAVQDVLNAGLYLQVHVWMPMVDNPEAEVEVMGDLAPFAREEFLDNFDEDVPVKVDAFGTWDAWNCIRVLCKYHSRLAVALSMARQAPTPAVLSRWYSEPIRFLSFSSKTFIANPRGYPVLPKAHQAFIARTMRSRTQPWLLLSDVGAIPGLESPDAQASVFDGTFNPDSATDSEYPSLSQSQSNKNRKKDPTPHLAYIRNLQQKQPSRTPIERFGTGYQDFLQSPLQPLTVNLESVTYEVFEKDPIKYDWYEQAIHRALTDWVEQRKPTSAPDGRIVVAVVGAGRGPLVTRALRASDEAGVPIEMWLVEKNPNAFVLLQRHNETTWGGRVNLVKSDMRSWKGPVREKAPSIGQAISDSAEIEQSFHSANGGDSGTFSTDGSSGGSMIHTPVDIFVSELLGSFADNELSPECLDGVCHLLHPVHGISIPASYTAHLTPIAAPKLYADIMRQSLSEPNAPEIPYVVMLHAIDYLSTTSTPLGSQGPSPSDPRSSTPLQPQQLQSSETNARPQSTTPVPEQALIPNVQTAWSFSHPNPNTPSATLLSSPDFSNAHNERHSRLEFRCRDRGVCHGLAGYFETVLYEGVELSTNPVTMDEKSKDMISWFPIYFPLKTPLQIPNNATIVTNMWRKTDNRKVWYEWMVEVFSWDKVHGSGKGAAGRADARSFRRVKVGMSELHSSFKEGCLM